MPGREEELTTPAAADAPPANGSAANGSAYDAGSASAQLRVRFVARQPKYAVTDKPILVPAGLKRYGLSEVVNHLLGTERAVPFDFLVDGAFLRTSLRNYLRENDLSAENLLTLEYVESMLPPSALSTLKHDDWVSSVAGHAHHSLFLTGSYDSGVRIWNAVGECVATARGHSLPVRDVAWVHPADGADGLTFLSAGQDGSVFGWSVASHGPDVSQEKPTILYDARGHTAGVESVCVSGDGAHFATASSDATVRVWSTAFTDEDEDVSAAADVSRDASAKRRKTKDDSRPRKSALAVLAGHVGPASAVTYNSSSGALYSGGWDHSVRVWDVKSSTNVVTKNSEKVVLCIDHSNSSGLLASGHSDHVVRLWDLRAEDPSVVCLSLAAHRNWVSSVSWSSTSAYGLASASYDGSVKVWDIRSRTPLYTVYDSESQPPSKEARKVLAVDWGREFILSGGEAAELRIHRLAERPKDNDLKTGGNPGVAEMGM